MTEVKNSPGIYAYTHNYKQFCILECFDTNILYQFDDYKITFVNSQHEYINSKNNFVIKDF